ncbi:MAG TPA: hypothetical protein VK475_00705 [Pyrinomonadaceae bacterium]|nr:hypothetical protein [Pyrinomonadaceae bacterium]
MPVGQQTRQLVAASKAPMSVPSLVGALATPGSLTEGGKLWCPGPAGGDTLAGPFRFVIPAHSARSTFFADFDS